MLQQHEPMAIGSCSSPAGRRRGALVEQARALGDAAEGDEGEALERARRHLDVERAVVACVGGGLASVLSRRTVSASVSMWNDASISDSQACSAAGGSSSTSRRARWSQPLATGVDSAHGAVVPGQEGGVVGGLRRLAALAAQRVGLLTRLDRRPDVVQPPAGRGEALEGVRRRLDGQRRLELHGRLAPVAAQQGVEPGRSPGRGIRRRCLGRQRRLRLVTGWRPSPHRGPGCPSPRRRRRSRCPRRS